MKVTIKAESKFLGTTEKMEGVDFDLVTIKETKKRNGRTVKEVRVARGKRDIRFSTGNYDIITVQDEETGRFLEKIER